VTVRAVIIGLLLALAIAAFGYVSDWVLKASLASDLIPVIVYGLLVLGLLMVNPMLRWTGMGQLSGAEWCVIISLMLVACVIPGPGMMWNFSNTIVMPHHYNRMNVGWRADKLLEYANPTMLVDADYNYDAVVDGFRGGLRQGRLIGVDEVPWAAWTRTLLFWMPLMGLSFLGGICLVLVVHQQWAHKERLRYPVADFASELINGAGTGSLPAIFRNRRFWLGFAPVMAILLINGYQSAYNTESIQIPLTIKLNPFAQKWPVITQLPYTWKLQNPTLYFAAIGFAYFISSEVSFSVGISTVLHSVLFLSLLRAGVKMQSDVLTGGIKGFQLFGSYLGLALIILYTGRKFYWAVLRKALFIPAAEPADRTAVWGCRGALLIATAMVVILHSAVKLDWLLAVAFVMLTGLLFLMVTRISAETGLFFIQPSWHAVSVLLGLVGMAAMGPNLLITLALLSMVMAIDPRVAMMPMVANALRFSEGQGVRTSRLSWWLALGVVLALIVGVFATIYAQYIYGGGNLYGWASDVSQYPFDMLKRNLTRFTGGPGEWQPLQLSAISPDREFLAAAGVGLAMVLVVSVLRLRYQWWPLHPVAFLVWGTWATACIAPSFLMGWLIKIVITRLGGGKAYRNSKPIFVGMVAAELTAGLIWAIIALIYYLGNDGVAANRIVIHP